LFEIYLPHAEQVCIVGDFTGGMDHACPMARCAEPERGWWRSRLRIPPGDHTFSYLVDGVGWLPDYAAGGLHRDRAGRWVSLLTVPERVPVTAIKRPRPDRHERSRIADDAWTFSRRFSTAAPNAPARNP
jgi:1,4-alpha-glucan branching enzyme